MFDPEFASYEAGKQGNHLGVVITGDALQNVRNQGAFVRGQIEADQAARLSEGSTGTAGGGALLTVIEACVFTWFIFHTQYAVIEGISRLSGSSNSQFLIQIGIGFTVFVAYGFAAVFLVKKLGWVAIGLFGLIWAYAGIKLAEHFGGSDEWKIGTAAVLGLLAVGEKYVLSKD